MHTYPYFLENLRKNEPSTSSIIQIPEISIPEDIHRNKLSQTRWPLATPKRPVDLLSESKRITNKRVPIVVSALLLRSLEWPARNEISLVWSVTAGTESFTGPRTEGWYSLIQKLQGAASGQEGSVCKLLPDRRISTEGACKAWGHSESESLFLSISLSLVHSAGSTCYANMFPAYGCACASLTNITKVPRADVAGWTREGAWADFPSRVCAMGAYLTERTVRFGLHRWNLSLGRCWRKI